MDRQMVRSKDPCLQCGNIYFRYKIECRRKFCSRLCYFSSRVGKAVREKRIYKKTPQKLILMKYERNLRIKAINHLGGKCNCCGEDRMQFLGIHHVNKDGVIERQIRGTSAMRRSIIRTPANDLKGIYEALCWNCHLATDWYGICPHKLELSAVVGLGG